MTKQMILLLLNVLLVEASRSAHFHPNIEVTIPDTLADCVHTRKAIGRSCRRKHKYRTFDGTCNNLHNPTWGGSQTRARRLLPAQFFDAEGIDTPYGHPSIFRSVSTPQDVSDKLFEIIDKDDGNNKMVSHLFMTFGQFVDHDLVAILHDTHACAYTKCRIPGDFKYPCFPIVGATKRTKCVRFIRSFAECQDFREVRTTRQNVNSITSFLDGSTIYGNDFRAIIRMTNRAHRHVFRSELHKVNGAEMLPFDRELPEACNDQPDRGGCYLAGDERVSENIALAGMHTVFVRLHNYYSRKLAKQKPGMNSWTVFFETRKIVISIFQHILYKEWLPFVTDKIPKYRRYNNRINPSVSNVFGTVAFRFGHTLVKNAFQQLDENFNDIAKPIPVRNTFFNMTHLIRNGIEPTMLGLMANLSEAVDTKIAASIGKHLFTAPRRLSFQNLIAINIQRARDHGIPSYTKWVETCHNRKVYSFDDFKEIRNATVREMLLELYGSVHSYIDPFPALLAETPRKGLLVGPTLECILKEQFIRLRDGDRFYYERKGLFKREQLHEIRKMTLAKVMCITLKKVVSIQKDVFKVFDPKKNRRISCEEYADIDLSKW